MLSVDLWTLMNARVSLFSSSFSVISSGSFNVSFLLVPTDLFKPMFRSSIISFANLSVGLEVHGCVTNVTTFGAFVDIGVEADAFVPISHFPMRPGPRRLSDGGAAGNFNCGPRSILQKLSLRHGDRIKAKVEYANRQESRIGLKDVQLLCDTRNKL